MKKLIPVAVVLAAFLSMAALQAIAQTPLPLPQPSPKATVEQTVGIAQVRVTYSRPGVKGRPVWGELVPYGEVWRAGANENTTISFSQDAQVGGKSLPAGTYGLHMIPTKGEWTVIFSSNATSWGSFFYKESEDALRFTVTPQPAEFREWLQYEFSDLTDTSAVLALSWEKVRIPIRLGFDTPAQVVAYAKTVHLRGLAGFGWQGLNQVAQYCAGRNIHLPEALKWADESISLNENFTNLRTKAAVLERMTKGDEAKALRERAMAMATEADINALGYNFLAQNKTKEALEMFQKNVKEHPNSWNAHDSLAEGYQKSGNLKGAIEYYEKALKMVGDERNKKRITDTLSQLRAM